MEVIEVDVVDEMGLMRWGLVATRRETAIYPQRHVYSTALLRSVFDGEFFPKRQFEPTMMI